MNDLLGTPLSVVSYHVWRLYHFLATWPKKLTKSSNTLFFFTAVTSCCDSIFKIVSVTPEKKRNKSLSLTYILILVLLKSKVPFQHHSLVTWSAAVILWRCFCLLSKESGLHRSYNANTCKNHVTDVSQI